MVSAIDLAKRALVSLLKTLAGVYGVAMSLTRESPNKDVSRVCGVSGQNLTRAATHSTHPLL